MGRPASHGLSREPWYSGSAAGPAAAARRGSHPLGRCIPTASCSRDRAGAGPLLARIRCPQPDDSAEVGRLGAVVWTGPRSLAATKGFAFAFSTQVLRCFSSPLWTRSGPSGPPSRPAGLGVSPFGDPRIDACDAAPRGLSWRATTFFAPSAPEASPVCWCCLSPVKLSRSESVLGNHIVMCVGSIP